MNSSLPPDDDQTAAHAPVPPSIESETPRDDEAADHAPGDANGNVAAKTADDDTATRQRGAHGRRRRGRGGHSEGERPAPLNGQAQVPAVPSAPLAGDGDDINPAAMAEVALPRELLERGRRAAKQTLNAQSEKLHKVLADAGIGEWATCAWPRARTGSSRRSSSTAA